MRRTGTMFYSALLLTGANLALRMVSMGFQVYLSGQIGAAGIGLLQLVLSVSMLAMTAGMGGIRTSAMYLTAEEVGSGRWQGVRRVLSACFLYSFFLVPPWRCWFGSAPPGGGSLDRRPANSGGPADLRRLFAGGVPGRRHDGILHRSRADSGAGGGGNSGASGFYGGDCFALIPLGLRRPGAGLLRRGGRQQRRLSCDPSVPSVSAEPGKRTGFRTGRRRRYR